MEDINANAKGMATNMEAGFKRMTSEMTSVKRAVSSIKKPHAPSTEPHDLDGVRELHHFQTPTTARAGVRPSNSLSELLEEEEEGINQIK